MLGAKLSCSFFFKIALYDFYVRHDDNSCLINLNTTFNFLFQFIQEISSNRLWLNNQENALLPPKDDILSSNFSSSFGTVLLSFFVFAVNTFFLNRAYLMAKIQFYSGISAIN